MYFCLIAKWKTHKLVFFNKPNFTMKNHYSLSSSIRRMITAGLVLFTGLLFGVQAYGQQFAIELNRASTSVDVMKDNMQKLEATFSFQGITTFGVEAEKGLFNEISIPGTYSTGALGTPKLPASKQLIEIPFGADVHVQVKNYTVNEYKLSDFGIAHKIMPVQPSLRKDMDASDVVFEYDENIYNRDEFITHEMAQIEVLGVMRSYRIARLTVAPVSYNPVKGIIRVYNDIEVEVSYTNVDEALTDYVKASTYSPYFEPISKSLLNNTGREYPNHPDLTTYPVRYLIVSDRMFEDELQEFIEWKTMKGFSVTVAYTDEIGTSYNQIQGYIHRSKGEVIFSSSV